MKKQTIKLNESKLRNIIKETVFSYLNTDLLTMYAVAASEQNGDLIPDTIKKFYDKQCALDYKAELENKGINRVLLFTKEPNSEWKLKSSESQLRNIIKESVKKVLNEDGDIYYQHENADDMLDQIYNILEKQYGSEVSNVGICQALWLLIYYGSNEMRFLANQYIEKNGGIEGVIKHDLLSYQIEHIKPYVGSLKDLYDYPPEPNGWYQGEPYFGKFPGKIEGEFASY
jgi:hypothetical protein